ncbi:type II and III secretion system protein family protein [Rhodoferax ferrireducens]|uniref:type II and III secretion system protein family protein n=1 Tax=Rhodoferax ferrireducens TaxID=192843 RepID=UPI001E64DB1D|nr:pilus assembly protein N-terminal domain-containing protein [Rhodoferax ferrireducens]
MKCIHKKSALSLALMLFALSNYAEEVVAARKRAEVKQAQPVAPLDLKADFAGEIEMFAGETRVIKEPNVARLAVGNGKLLSAAVLDNKEMLLMASDVGVSSLQVWTRDGRNRRIKITVVPESARVSREIAAFLAAMPNTKATLIGDKVVVDGDNLSDRDLSKIDELAKRYPQIVNFTNRIGWEKMIVMDVKVVEFPTTALKEIGLKWGATGGVAVGAVMAPYQRGEAGPYQINLINGIANAAPITSPGGGPIPLTSSLNVLSILNMGLNGQLNLMEQNGSAVILAQPTLSTRSGSKASFLAGGEFPYSVSNINGTTVLFKPYGIRLEILPSVDHNGVIRAKIMSEVSDIDTSVSGIGGPALRTRKTETEFNVMAGGTIVLSGLLRRDVSSAVDKVPLLGDIPVLGALFRSKRFQNNETELVVFVTPRAEDKHSPAQEESMTHAVERLQQTPRVGVQDLRSVPIPSGPDNPEPGAQPGKPTPMDR